MSAPLGSSINGHAVGQQYGGVVVGLGDRAAGWRR